VGNLAKSRLAQDRQNGASGTLPAMATGYHSFKFIGHALKVCHPSADVRQVTTR
jgi:hypothetical protein